MLVDFAAECVLGCRDQFCAVVAVAVVVAVAAAAAAAAAVVVVAAAAVAAAVAVVVEAAAVEVVVVAAAAAEVVDDAVPEVADLSHWVDEYPCHPDSQKAPLASKAVAALPEPESLLLYIEFRLYAMRLCYSMLIAPQVSMYTPMPWNHSTAKRWELLHIKRCLRRY